MPIQPKTSNILPKFCQKLATTLRVRCRFPTFPKKTVSGQPGHPPVHRPSARSPGIDRTHIRRDKERCFRKCIFRKCIFRKFCKFLAGSFSAVSKRNFARKYAFDSIFQALQDLHPFAPLQSQKFRKKSV